ncbi:MAG: ribonuclease R family protein [Kiritimatiellia bacterium]|jgi:ribonuclease R
MQHTPSASAETDALRYLFESDPEHVWAVDEIGAILGYRGKRRSRLVKLLKGLVAEGAVQERASGHFALGKGAGLITGRLSAVRSGNAYLDDPASGRSYRISAEDLATALHGDTVEIRPVVGAAARGHASAAKVVRVVRRAARDIVGTLVKAGRTLYVLPLDPIYRRDFRVKDAHGAKEGDRVVIRFQEWAHRDADPEAEIVDVIGPAYKPSLDTEAVCRQYGLPGDFPAKAVREAETVSGLLASPGRREDLRDLYTLTIDPPTARDFDDAISMTRDKRGRRVLGVHIADVAHFVRKGGALDAEARERGTSVYLVDRVIPMLPEQLSNGVCSLRPGEDRLCLSAFLAFDDAGKQVACRFAKTVIRSRLRLDYGQALDMIEGRAVADLPDPPAEALATVRAADALARQLREARMRAGALDLEVPECEIVLDAEGRMTGVRLTPSDPSHQLIEECMVAANEAVASALQSRGIRILSRLHEPPDPEKMEELSASLAALGFRAGSLKDPRILSRFLASTAGHPLRDQAHTLTLRSLKRAVYSADASGHFGLAKKHYAHFTSPIRRYPDLVLHRQLAGLLSGGPSRASLPVPQLASLAELATDREQRADDAERALLEIKKFRFLQQQIDDRSLDTYEAAISRVTNFGIFVDVRVLQLGGLVHVGGLSRRALRYDRLKETLSDGRTTFRVGDVVRVQVERVDFDQRRVDFSLAAEEKPSPGRKPSRRKTPSRSSKGTPPKKPPKKMPRKGAVRGKRRPAR